METKQHTIRSHWIKGEVKSEIKTILELSESENIESVFMCMFCPQRPEEGIKIPGITDITVIRHFVGARN